MLSMVRAEYLLREVVLGFFKTCLHIFRLRLLFLALDIQMSHEQF